MEGEREPAATCADCPVGFLRDVVHEAHPEATLHLVAAARELVLAFDTVLRAAEASLQREAAARGEPDVAPAASAPTGRERPGRPARVRHIDIA